MAKDTIALVISTLNNPFFVSLKDGAQKKLTSWATTGGAGFPEQPGERAGERPDLTVRGTKLLLINPTDSDAVGNAVKMANRAKIPVITLDRQATKAML